MRRCALITLVALALPASALAGETCTFTDWAWHSADGRAVDYQTVRMDRDSLTASQRHPELPCSVCSEDQVEIRLSSGDNVTVCHILAPAIGFALEQAVEAGFPLQTVTGYRVGRTRGPLDGQGLRTEYSNHSFGLAIDLNVEFNGLYDRCVEWGPSCRLRRGGVWRPNDPRSLTPKSPAYLALTEAGLKWGGVLEGRQKDFMHFSLEGD